MDDECAKYGNHIGDYVNLFFFTLHTFYCTIIFMRLNKIAKTIPNRDNRIDRLIVIYS